MCQPSTTRPTHNEDGNKAGQRSVPVSIAGGCRLAHQDAVEDEVSQAKLHTPCVEKRKCRWSNLTGKQEADKREKKKVRGQDIGQATQQEDKMRVSLGRVLSITD